MPENTPGNLIQNESGATAANGKMNGVAHSESDACLIDSEPVRLRTGLREMISSRWRLDRMRFLVQGLLALAVVSTLLLFGLLMVDGRLLSQRFHLPEAVAAQPAPAYAVSNKPKKSVLTVFDRRPYFREQQRRTVTQTASGPVDAMELPAFSSKFTLLGILMGETPQAIVKENSSGATVFLLQGQSLTGYQVHEILPDHVVLQRDGELVNLRM